MRKEAEVKDSACKCMPTPKPSEFAISLTAYIQTTTWMRPPYGHKGEEQVSNKEQNDSN
jgi:hypothetical protein